MNKQAAIIERIIFSLIVLSLVSFAIETLPSMQAYGRLFGLFETVTLVIFSVEYLVRSIRGGRGYILSAYGIIDLVAVLPFFLSLGFDLRSVRILRVFRLLRLGKLHRYGTAWNNISRAIASVRNELVVYFGLTVILVYLASVGIYYCEHDAQPEAFASIPHAMWWAVATLSTVGYGDVYPITWAGKLLTFVILILGLSVVSVPSGLLASALVRPNPSEAESLDG